VCVAATVGHRQQSSDFLQRKGGDHANCRLFKFSGLLPIICEDDQSYFSPRPSMASSAFRQFDQRGIAIAQRGQPDQVKAGYMVTRHTLSVAQTAVVQGCPDGWQRSVGIFHGDAISKYAHCTAAASPLFVVLRNLFERPRCRLDKVGSHLRHSSLSFAHNPRIEYGRFSGG
jgi:hypothetical protein